MAKSSKTSSKRPSKPMRRPAEAAAVRSAVKGASQAQTKSAHATAAPKPVSKPAARGEQTLLDLDSTAENTARPIAEESVAGSKKGGQPLERKGAKPLPSAKAPPAAAEPAPKGAAKGAAKGAVKAGPASKHTQPEPEDAAPEEAATADASTGDASTDEALTGGTLDDFAQPVPEAPLNPVVELANTSKGCWKIIDDGTKSQLSDKEWRQELARLLERPPALPS